MDASLLVEGYDAILAGVVEKYPNAPTSIHHNIAMHLSSKLRDSREKYAQNYKELYRENEEAKEIREVISDKVSSLDNNLNEFMKVNRSYQTWTTRYPHTSNRI